METDPIIIRIQAIDEATEKITSIAKSLKGLELKVPTISTAGTYKQVNVIKRNFDSLTPSIAKLDEQLKIAGISERQFTSFLSKNNMEIMEGGIVYDRLTGKVMMQGLAIKKATLDLRRFKFEWLSVMFAGMALERVFGGIVKSQMDLYGVTQLQSDAWTIIMEEVMGPLSDKLYDLADAMMNLPPEVKTAIGITVIGGDILGKVLSALGQIALAVMGLKALFPGLAAAVSGAGGGILGVFKALGAAIVGLGATFFIVAGIVVAVIIGMYLAWKTNFLNMKQTVQNFIDAFKQWFRGIVSWFSGILDVIVGLFTGDFEKVKEGIKKIFTGMFNWLVGGFKMTFNLVVGIVKGALKIIYNIIKVIVDGIIWVINSLAKIGGKRSDVISFRMPTFEKGGIMPYTGLAYLHAGEKVIPANQVNSSESNIIFSPTVNLNASVSSDMDIRELADKLNSYWARDFERMTQRRVS